MNISATPPRIQYTCLMCTPTNLVLEGRAVDLHHAQRADHAAPAPAAPSRNRERKRSGSWLPRREQRRRAERWRSGWAWGFLLAGSVRGCHCSGRLGRLGRRNRLLRLRHLGRATSVASRSAGRFGCSPCATPGADATGFALPSAVTLKCPACSLSGLLAHRPHATPPQLRPCLLPARRIGLGDLRLDACAASRRRP